MQTAYPGPFSAVCWMLGFRWTVYTGRAGLSSRACPPLSACGRQCSGQQAAGWSGAGPSHPSPQGVSWGNKKARQLQTAPSEGWGLRAAPSATLEPGPWNHSVCARRWRDLEALPTAWDNNPHRSSCPGPSWKPCLDRACPLSLASNPKFPGRMFCPFSRSLPLPEPRAAPPSPKNALSEAADPAHNVASPREVTY